MIDAILNAIIIGGAGILAYEIVWPIIAFVL